MDHGGFDAKNRQDDEGEIVICRHNHAVAGRAGVLVADSVKLAICIDWAAHAREESDASVFGGTNGNVEIIDVAGCRCISHRYIPEEEAYHDAAGLILD